MNKLIVIVGPTSSKKSKLALELNKEFSFPIINADAFQVYKELNCGTNKLDKDIIEKTPIYLMDNISIYDQWSIADFQKIAKKIIGDFHSQKMIPLIVGGSNLYVDCLIKNYDLSSIAKRNNKYDALENKELWNKLNEIDKQQALKISINNRKRLLRALEIIEESGTTKTLKDANRQSKYECFVIYVSVDREELYQDINNNVDKMFKLGWKKEVEDLLKKDSSIKNLNALKAIGYSNIIDAIENKNEINIDLIKQKSRQYAKRQLTWCKNKYDEKFVFNWKNKKELVNEIRKFIND